MNALDVDFAHHNIAVSGYTYHIVLDRTIQQYYEVCVCMCVYM